MNDFNPVKTGNKFLDTDQRNRFIPTHLPESQLHSYYKGVIDGLTMLDATDDKNLKELKQSTVKKYEVLIEDLLKNYSTKGVF